MWGRTALTSVSRNAFRFCAFSTVRSTAAPTASYFRRSSASIRSGARGAGSLTYAMTSSSCSSGTEQYRNTSSRVAGRAKCFSNRTTASAKPSIFATWIRSSAVFLPDCAGSYAGSRASAASKDRGVEFAGPFLREASHVPERLVGRAGDRRVGERVRGGGELFDLHVEETFASPGIAEFRMGLDRGVEGGERLGVPAERLVCLALPCQHARIRWTCLQDEVEAGERVRGMSGPQAAQPLRAVRVVVVRILLEDDREEREL